MVDERKSLQRLPTSVDLLRALEKVSEREPAPDEKSSRPAATVVEVLSLATPRSRAGRASNEQNLVGPPGASSSSNRAELAHVLDQQASREKPPSTRRSAREAEGTAVAVGVVPLVTPSQPIEFPAQVTQEAVQVAQEKKLPSTRRSGVQPLGPPAQPLETLVESATKVPSFRVAVASHSWDGPGTSGEDGEYLLFSVNARIEIEPGAELEPGGWWYGRLGDRTGWFPSSYTALEETQAAVCDTAAGGAASLPGSTYPPPLPRSFSMQAIDQGLLAYGVQIGSLDDAGAVRV